MGFADLVSRITGLLSTIGQLMLLVSLPILLLGGEAPPLLPMLVLIAAPTISSLVQLALSRNRELEADRSAAELTGDPEGLARALTKLDRYQGSYWEQLVMPGRNIPEPSVLRTHPPVEERVRRLMALAPDRAPTRPVPLGRRGEERYNVAANGRSTPARPRWHISGLWY
jgi:heat shock protein HtpX